MSFIGKFFLVVLLLGFAELYLLVGAANVIGFGGTLALCILTGVVGGALVRHQGLRTLLEIQQTMGRGMVPTVEIVSGLVLLLVGAMLITPGFITDTFGFLMLIPAVRLWVSGKLARHFEGRISTFSPPNFPPADGQPRERQIIDIDPEQ